MKKALFLLVSFLCSYISRSQNSYQSKVADSATDKPVGYATISVYKTGNASKAVQNVITAEDGSFTVVIKDTAVINSLSYTHRIMRQLTC